MEIFKIMSKHIEHTKRVTIRHKTIMKVVWICAAIFMVGSILNAIFNPFSVSVSQVTVPVQPQAEQPQDSTPQPPQMLIIPPKGTDI